MSVAKTTGAPVSSPLLDIQALHVAVEGHEILSGVNLRIEHGEVHAIMGPNGSGKSTLAYVLSGKEGYEVTSGSVFYEGQDLLGLDIEERARAGLFLGFQYPVSIDGVSTMNFLKTAVNACRMARGDSNLDAVAFLREVRARASDLGISEDILKRYLNLGFSGGEKKRGEILQMLLLEPNLAVLDETDSGLDVDALRTVSRGITSLRNPSRSILLITHYQRLLSHVRPDKVHIMARGVILDSGDAELALQVEKEGYANFQLTPGS